jgi:hypothetical protein
MKPLNFNPATLWNTTVLPAVGSRARVCLVIFVIVTGSVLVTVGVRAYNRAPMRAGSTVKPSPEAPIVQKGRLSGTSAHRRLSFQPEADRFRQRIGKRFNESGRERSTLVGRLTVGAQQYQVRFVRTQEDDDEQVEIALNGGPTSLTWNGKGGAKSTGRDALGIERSLIERLVLDSPDQLVLAQLRGATYFTVALGAKPPGPPPTEDYDGPLWDVIRVAETDNPGVSKPQSPWRLYHLNSRTGLLEKVISQEDGELTEAVFSDWVDRDGDLIPSHITWTKGSQTIMELVLASAAFGPRQ